MGLIKAAASAVSGTFADQYLEVFKADDMGGQTVFTKGVKVRKGDNKGTENVISNGSMIMVNENQFMLLVDGGKIVDYTAEPGYYKVDNSSMPSFFNGQFAAPAKDLFDRIRFGGQTPLEQKVFFINLQEIKGIKFGTRNPINYFDTFYNGELFLRAHGTFSFKITNPLQFYAEVVEKNSDHMEAEPLMQNYMAEFLQALQTAINQMSAEGMRISFVTSKATELGKKMSTILDEEWTANRGMMIQTAAIASISYDEESQELINLRNKTTMWMDPEILHARAVLNITEGVKDAGGNAGGAMGGFMGVGMGMNALNNSMDAINKIGAPNNGAASNGMNQNMAGVAGMAQAAGAQATGWTCECGHVNTGKFCSECGKPMPAPAETEWSCECGQVNTGKFCSNCGKPKPVVATEWTCECGQTNTGKFCSNCGKARN
ncbi:MAG: SPFH domain-containing protein [Roseburia sp.]